MKSRLAGILLMTTFMMPALTSAVARAQASEQLSLADAVKIAAAQNPDLAAASQELNVARGEIQRASYLSPFNLEGDNEFAYRARQNRSNSQDWRLGMMQEFEIFGQRGLRQKSASIAFEQSAADFADRRRLLIGAVKLTFFDAIRARDRAQLLTELESLDARLVAAARTRLAAGEINIIDYNLAEVRYGRSHRAMLEGREQFRAMRSSLGRLLGGAMGLEPVPSGEFRPVPLALQLDVLIAKARQNRPDLRTRQLEIVRLETDTALNSRLNLPNPIIGVFGGHDQNTEHFVGPMLGFSVPLFNRRTAEAAILAAREAQARQRLRATNLNVEREVRDAYNQYRTAIEAVRIYESEVVAPARESMGLLERAFTEGKIDLLHLSVAEREAFEAQSSYLDAWFNAMAAEVALELATGVSS